jgi:hypothetical protein
VAAALLVMTGVAMLVHERVVRVVGDRHLLPHWDPAAHLLDGWIGYWSLRTMQPWTFFWNFREEGLWPPAYALWQVPFYFAVGPELTSGLTATLAAFALLGVAGALVLVLDSPKRDAAVVPVTLWLVLVVTSPYYLAYSAIGMMETFGAFAQTLVYLAWSVDRRRRGATSGRLFALSLTLLFFAKYNYLVLCVAPMLLHEFLGRTAGASLARRIEQARSALRTAWTSPTIRVVALYLIALVILIRSGGFDVRVLGHEVSVHRVGATGHIVLIAVGARILFLHRRRRIDWQALLAVDRRVRPLLIWFVLPVTVWLLSPYPNHLRDFVDLLVNQPHGVEGLGSSIGLYVQAFGRYFRGREELWVTAALFAVITVRFRRCTPLTRLLFVTAATGFVLSALHQNRQERFLFTTLLPLWLGAAAATGGWFSSGVYRRAIGAALALAMLVHTARAVPAMVDSDAFRARAFAFYATGDEIPAAFDWLRGRLPRDGRLVVHGRGNRFSPSLFGWELGPPAGFVRFPVCVRNSGPEDRTAADHLLLIVSTAPVTDPDIDLHDEVHREKVQRRLDLGEFEPDSVFPLRETGLEFRLYRAKAGVGE